MPTFYNTSPNGIPLSHPKAAIPDAPAASITMPMTPTDDVVIHNFRTATPDAVRKLNGEFALHLTPARFATLQAIARDDLGREITVAELRLLTALDETGRGRADREAPGVLTSESATIAETWADMMDKHTALTAAYRPVKTAYATPIPPCTYADALQLSDRFLHRSGSPLMDTPRRGRDEIVVLTDPDREPVAVAAGYRPVARLVVGKALEETVIIATRHTEPPREAPAHAGDYLLHLPTASLSAVADFLAADGQERKPMVSAIAAVSDCSYLDTILELAPGADIYTARLIPPPPVATVEDDPAPMPATDGEATTPTTDGESRTQEAATEVAATESNISSEETAVVSETAVVEAETDAPSAEASEPAEAIAEVASAATDEIAAPTAPNTQTALKMPSSTAKTTGPQPGVTGAKPQVKIPDPPLPVAELTEIRHPMGGRADFILRVPQKHLKRLTDALRERHITANAIGQVRDGECLRLYLHRGSRDIPVVSLPSDVLKKAAAVHLHEVTPRLDGENTPLSHGREFPDATGTDTVNAHPLVRLPGVLPCEDGLTPQGGEIVTLTLPSESILTLRAPDEHGPDMVLSTASVTVTGAGTGFRAAAEALLTAARPLCERGVPPSEIRMAVSLTVREELAALPSEDMAPGSLTLEVICGLYRVAAENGLPILDPSVRTVPSTDAPPSVTLTVTAWHLIPAHTPTATENTDDGQWTAGHNGTGEDSLVVRMPVLRRSYEGVLRALATALTRREGADCRLCPVALTTEPLPTAEAEATEAPEVGAPTGAVTDTAMAEAGAPVETAVTDGTAAKTASPASEIPPENIPPSTLTAPANNEADAQTDTPRASPVEAEHPSSPAVGPERLVPVSVERLVQAMQEAMLVPFAMSAEDARLLLREPTVRATLEAVAATGRWILVLGEACAAFAEAGLLPEVLATLTTHPAAGAYAKVSYAFRERGAARLVRTALLAPAVPAAASAMVTLTLPDGTVIGDGFASPDGHIIGLLNGLDPMLVDYIRP